MATFVPEHIKNIRRINDQCRKTFTGCQVMTTPEVRALDDAQRAALFKAIREFDDFNEGNDPWGDHDFGSVEMFGATWFFKFEYFDRTMENGSEDPADIENTIRVLTIMQSSEY